MTQSQHSEQLSKNKHQSGKPTINFTTEDRKLGTQIMSRQRQSETSLEAKNGQKGSSNVVAKGYTREATTKAISSRKLIKKACKSQSLSNYTINNKVNQQANSALNTEDRMQNQSKKVELGISQRQISGVRSYKKVSTENDEAQPKMEIILIKSGQQKVSTENSKNSKEDGMMAMIDIDKYITTNDEVVAENENLQNKLELLDDYTENKDVKGGKKSRERSERSTKHHVDLIGIMRQN